MMQIQEGRKDKKAGEKPIKVSEAQETAGASESGSWLEEDDESGSLKQSRAEEVGLDLVKSNANPVLLFFLVVFLSCVVHFPRVVFLRYACVAFLRYDMRCVPQLCMLRLSAS